MDRILKISLYKIIITTLVITLTVLLIIEVRVKEQVVVETINSNNVSLFDCDHNEVECISFENLNPYEEINYYVKLENYNVDNLEYRIVVDILSSTQITNNLEVKFNNQILEFNNYRGVSNWDYTKNDEEYFLLSFKYNSTSNNLQNSLIEFDFRIESIKN